MNALIEKTVSFEDMLIRNNISAGRDEVRILQLNIGRRCNQSCKHCHVEAGPQRTENMNRDTMDRVLDLLDLNPGIHTVDITGGAPELNPDFRYLVRELRLRKRHVIDRSNLTVFFEKGQEETPEFLSGNDVRIIASLPCYLEENVDNQRGEGVHKKCITALQRLNSLGYGKSGSGLIIDLVYNPSGACLPPEQVSLEADYKIFLKNIYGIDFNSLLTITNMPVGRFAGMLAGEGKYESYLRLLSDNFNPHTAQNLMCRELLSIGWDGRIYDCDFNQALRIPLKKKDVTVWDVSKLKMIEPEISFDRHCFACTAGNGSSCGGALI